MPDWEAKIRERLAPLRLDASREAEIVEELAQHLDDTYERLLTEGATPPQASDAALMELDRGDLEELKQRSSGGVIIMEPHTALSSRSKTTRMARPLTGSWARLALRPARIAKTAGLHAAGDSGAVIGDRVRDR